MARFFDEKRFEQGCLAMISCALLWWKERSLGQKIVQFLMLIGLSAAAAPHPRGATFEFEKDLVAYREAKTIADKFGAAQTAWAASMAFRSDPAWRSHLRKDLVRPLSEVENYVRYIERLVEEFETGLYPDEVAFLTSGAQFSIPQMSGKLSFLAGGQPQCTRLAYERLKEKVDLRELQRVAPSILVWAKANEQKNFRGYVERVQKLLQTSDKYLTHRQELAGYFEWLSKEQRHSSRLKKLAVTPELAMKWIALSPECLGGEDPQLVRWLETEPALSR